MTERRGWSEEIGVLRICVQQAVTSYADGQYDFCSLFC